MTSNSTHIHGLNFDSNGNCIWSHINGETGAPLKPPAVDSVGKDLKVSSYLNIETKMATEVLTTTISSDDLHIVKQERWDADVMETLINRGHEMGYATKDLRMLSAYRKARKSPGLNEVVYHFSKGMEKERVGRLYPRNMEGLQGFPKDIRNPLLQKHYWEVDMENAHYWLSEQIAENWGVKHDNISEYIQNRSEWLKQTDESPSRAKLGFLKAMYGGTIRDFMDIREDGDVKNPRLIQALEKELKSLRDMAWSKYPAVQKKVKGKSNPQASLYALVLQSAERDCLLAMDEFFKSKGRSVDVLIHDAGAVLKLPDEPYLPEQLLRECEAHIKSKTGFTVRLVSKGFQHSFVKPDAPHEEIDDAYASKVFVGLMGDFIAREDNDVYYFQKDTGMWDKNDTAFRCAVAQHKPKLIFKVGDLKLNYGGNEKNVSAMRKWIPTALPDTKFISRNADSSYGKLLFADGIYDFLTDSFHEGFDPSIVFNKRIDRPYPRKRNEENIKLINHILFESAFGTGDGLEAGVFLRKAVCMGLLGDYRRKKFYFGLGESCCGKGVLVGALTNAFGDYVSEYQANNLKYNERNGQDEARKLAWAKDLLGCRLAFSNEIRVDKTAIDGNLLKGLSSGGDIHKVRANYENEQKFVNRATMFLLANDMLPITPTDSGTRERCRFIRYRIRFVDEPTSADEKKKDPTIKSKFESNEYKDALFHLMVDTYKEMAEKEKTQGGDLYTPPCVMEETLEWVGTNADEDFSDCIRRRYDITGDEDDAVPSREIVRYITDTCKLRWSDVKIGRELTKMIARANPNMSRRDRQAQGDEVGKQRLGIRRKETAGIE